MKKITYSLITAALVTASVVAGAQDVAPDPRDAVPPTAEPVDPATTADPAAPLPGEAAPIDPATPADPAVAAEVGGEVTDAEVESFAQATVKLKEISADAALDSAAKQEQMVAAVAEAGLEPERYNAIGKATATDTELRAKVQTAMAKYSGPSDG